MVRASFAKFKKFLPVRALRFVIRDKRPSLARLYHIEQVQLSFLHRSARLFFCGHYNNDFLAIILEISIKSSVPYWAMSAARVFSRLAASTASARQKQGLRYQSAMLDVSRTTPQDFAPLTPSPFAALN